MKGIITKKVCGACLAGGLVALAGCHEYNNVVDPCYPQRYNYIAQHEVCEPIAAQVNNGHILDQTIWNDMFQKEAPTKLTKGGEEKLLYLARRRPSPDPVIYLATAQDITFNPDAAPDAFAQARTKRDNERIASIQNYLAAQTAGRGLNFQVLVHDPAEPYQSAIKMGAVIATNNLSFTGSRTASGQQVSGGVGAGISGGGR